LKRIKSKTTQKKKKKGEVKMSPKFDMEKMKQELLNRTKQSYDTKDGAVGNRYFDPDLDLPFFRPGPTSGKPHILDIIPFVAGPNFPTKTSSVKEGEWAYVLDLWVHKKVGPGKSTVVCPARNYGERCPICEEIESLTNQGVEYEDIPFSAKRQCCYNVWVVTNPESESKGVQIWDVSHRYSEKAIVSLAVSARDGGYIPFASPLKGIGRSLAFDVAKDKYKTISGHRFEHRDYDVPTEILEAAYSLDQIIVIYSYEELEKILYGEGGKPENARTPDLPGDEGDPDLGEPISRTGRGKVFGRGQTTESETPAEKTTTGTPRGTKKSFAKTEEKETCPIGAKFGEDHDQYQECADCELFKKCAEMADMIQYEASKGAEETTKTQTQQPAATGRRTLLRRG
jgi:hypothetical protein